MSRQRRRGPRLRLRLRLSATSLVALLLLGGTGLLPPLPLRAQEAPEDFGRWQSEVRRCQLGVTPGPERNLRCDSVRLDQQLPGLLSVRFFSRGQGPGPAKRLLIFAGILERGSPAMACRAGSCRWAGPLRTRVSALADLGKIGRAHV